MWCLLARAEELPVSSGLQHRRIPESAWPCRLETCPALMPSPRGSVHGLRGSEPRKHIHLWWLDGPHTLDTLEGFSRPEPAAHQLAYPDAAPQAAHLTPMGT